MEVTLAEFFMLILFVAFAGAGLSIFLDRRREQARSGAIKRSVIRCRVCGHAYAVPLDERGARCPGCGRDNLRGRDRRLG